jgi:dTDP-4-dehydrorhamnose 3,5-epimerase
LVHISSDYVFDGSEVVHIETEPFSPLGVYGQTKAAADAVVESLPAHYILRTSWVIGDGHNFVRTMASLADRGINPEVVDDQFGRLTFTAEISRAIVHLLQVEAPSELTTSPTRASLRRGLASPGQCSRHVAAMPTRSRA